MLPFLQTPREHARYLVLRNCRQDLPAAYTAIRALCRTVALTLRSAAAAAADVVLQPAVRQRPAGRRFSGSAGLVSRTKSC